jgi:ubiquinone/menaquinone biosynthesis C-methylase UbiE
VGVGVDWKRRAVEQWTADPCGPDGTGAERLLAGRREYAPWMAEQLDYNGAAGLDVLDLGCGQGIDVCEFARVGARVTGIDLTPRHIELALEHVEEFGVEATLLEGDVERLPFADSSFDRVVSNGVLHHTPDIEAALREARRVLRPGGSFTVILYNRNSWHYWLSQFLWRGVVRRQMLRERSMSAVLSANVEFSTIGARPLVRVYSRRQVHRLLRHTGFRSVVTWVCPFRAGDAPFVEHLPSRLRRTGGWYVVGHGRRLT